MYNLKFTKLATLACAIATIILGSSSAFAYYTVQDTGDLIKPNQVQLGTSMQWITHGPTLGVNVLGHLDVGYNNSSNFRFEAGAGTTDAVLGAYYKWVPYPDYKQQPAIGLTVGAQYAHYKGATETSARLIPLASKRFDLDSESFVSTATPYVALPFAISSYSGKTQVPVQITLGAKVHLKPVKQWDFLAELDFDVNSAPNAIVIGADFNAF